MGPRSGAQGGEVVAQGSLDEVLENPRSCTAPFISGKAQIRVRDRATKDHLFGEGEIYLHTDAIHTVKPLEVHIPKGKLTVVTGVSGSGKTTLVLESLIPALKVLAENAAHTAEKTASSAAGKKGVLAAKVPSAARPFPDHVREIHANGIERANLIDANPIGTNVRSTVATYSGVLDDLRKAFAALDEAKAKGLKAGAFSYNTGSLRCPTCDGTGQISLDVQFLPDVDIPCPDCQGSRYGQDAYAIRRFVEGDDQAESFNAYSLPEILSLTVDEALRATRGLKRVVSKLQVLHDLGLGYLTLGEATPALSGGEAQRLKLASEFNRSQNTSLFVFDEPTIGLHPLDVEVLLGVLQRLIDNGATVVVIEHDLDVIANADYVIDMGPGGGESGGTVVCAGTPEEVCACEQSITGKFLKEVL